MAVSGQSATSQGPDLARLASLLLSAAAEGIYGLDASGNTTFANPAAEKMLGWEGVELIGRPMHATVHHSRPDGTPYPGAECPIHATLREGTVNHVTDEYFWSKDGTGFPVEYTSTPVWDEGTLAGAVVTFRDVSDKKQTESLEVLSQYLQALPVGVFVMSGDGKPVYANDEALELLGSGLVETATSDTLATVYKAYRAGTEDEYPPEEMPVVQALHGETARVEDMEIRRDGDVVPIEVWATPIRDEAGSVSCAVAVFRDISERKRLQRELAVRLDELEQLALEDELTGLPNQRSFTLVVEQQLKAIGRSQMPATLAIIDLHGLDAAADRHGRDLVSQWLEAFGRAINNNVHRPDIGARLDFNRFAVFAFGDDAHADALVARIESVLEGARQQQRWPTELTLRIGRASYNPNLPWTPQEFIAAAVPH